ncbi:MAG: SNF2-related protein [bacterium]
MVQKLFHPLREPLFYKIPAHAASSLFEAGYDSIRKLAGSTPGEIRDVPGIGSKGFEAIENLLIELDLEWGEELPEETDPLLPSSIKEYYEYIHSATNWWDRGVKYIRDGRVVSCSPEDQPEFEGASRAQARVRGGSEYRVQLNLAGVDFHCSCPTQGEWTHWGGPCKHVIAATIEMACKIRKRQLQDGLSSTTTNWERLADRMDPTPVTDQQPESLEYLLETQGRVPRLRPGLLDESGELRPLEARDDPNAHYLNQRDRLILSRLEAAAPASGLPIPEDEIGTVLGDLLPLFEDHTLHLRREGETAPVTVDLSELQVSFRLEKRDGELTLDTQLQDNDAVIDSIEQILSDPPWVLEQERLRPVEASSVERQLIDTIPADGLTIPPEDLASFGRHMLPLLTQNEVNLEMDDRLQASQAVEPVGRLELEEQQRTLLIRPMVQYGETPARPGRDQPLLSYDENQDRFLKIDRDLKRERELIEQFKQTNVVESGRYEETYRPEEDPIEWLVDELPELTENGFEVYGEESLTRYRRPQQPTKSEVVVRGSTDWFEVEGELEYEESTVSIAEIKQAVSEGKRFIELGDNRRGLIPEQWIDKWSELFEWSRSRGDKMEAPRATAGWIDELVEDVDQATVDDAFRETLDRLRTVDPESSLPTPDGFEGTLRTYQREGLAWLVFLNEAELGALLADDMGLGKTIQVLALLQEIHNRDGSYPYSLVVAPRSVLQNWKREINRFVPGVTVYMHHGTNREKDPAHWTDPDLILTTYGTLLRDIEQIEGEEFDLAVLDESHRIRNPNTKRAKACRALDASHRVCLTGTPVQNTTMDLWSQFQFLNPGFLGTKTGFKRALARPIEESRDDGATDRLQSLIQPFLLRRSKQEVEPDLPELSETTVDCKLTGKHRSAYDETFNQYRRMLDESIEQSGLDDSRFLILEGLTRLRQICCDPSLVDGYSGITSAKVSMFEQKAREAIENDHRVLVFSQFVEFLKILKQTAEESGWDYEYLDGQTRNRMEIVDRFQANEDIPLFFISLKAGGEGLNLTGANYVFLMDPWWNPAAEQQAADRTHRIGQDSRVFVYRFLSPDTVEDKIQDLKDRKKRVETDLLDPESGLFKQLEESDIQSLFNIEPKSQPVG